MVDCVAASGSGVSGDVTCDGNPPADYGDACNGNGWIGCDDTCSVIVQPNHTLTISNQSSFTIADLFVWPCGGTGMGPDLLSGHVIAPAGTYMVTGVPTGCWNMRAQTPGDSVFWQRFNTEIDADFTWTLTN
jgi:hypothetical protein